MNREQEVAQAYFNRTGKWPKGYYEQVIQQRRENNKSKRGPAITSQRKLALFEASRSRARDAGREFFYVQLRCENGHYSRRRVVDGVCVKCSM